MARPINPNAPTSTERNRLSRANRVVKTVELSALLLDRVNILRHPGEALSATITRILVAAIDKAIIEK